MWSVTPFHIPPYDECYAEFSVGTSFASHKATLLDNSTARSALVCEVPTLLWKRFLSLYSDALRAAGRMPSPTPASAGLEQDLIPSPSL